jgi:hypothetical protein
MAVWGTVFNTWMLSFPCFLNIQSTSPLFAACDILVSHLTTPDLGLTKSFIVVNSTLLNLGNLSFTSVSIMRPTWCTFYSIYLELWASTCFEHYLLILRRRYTNGTWYIVCVLCQLAATRVGVELAFQLHHIYKTYSVCFCMAVHSHITYGYEPPVTDASIANEQCTKNVRLHQCSSSGRLYKQLYGIFYFLNCEHVFGTHCLYRCMIK